MTTAGATEYAIADPNLEEPGKPCLLRFEQAFMFYLPRICEHRLNLCVASCPSGDVQARGGRDCPGRPGSVPWLAVLVCRPPHKKVCTSTYRTGKAEKCTMCAPRIESGQPTICLETCVGRLRYLGSVL